MKDFRGNVYPEEPLGETCAFCSSPAVRNCCVAEGKSGRTHWHGRIHTVAGNLEALCRTCADIENARWEKLRSDKNKFKV